MTIIIGGPTDVDLDSFCCCDPKVGGCPHPLSDHLPGGCRSSYCPCPAPQEHTAECMHRQQQTGGES